ncbi:glycoside hydrolase family 19 protein [Pseudomonas sp. TH05]|uniref:glycoside hydrolase family 19 protein n=1 Tax=unclassified Pseudomonas TaxID=196821 RepID=UPI00191197DC|nr:MULTISPECIES: glycoside hydrolase family 19 protein [unclassified Pseudomonas]MBK5541492.1 glycoside hydrolase family 19 protein [Pseudomonas sp. TH07]MBK5558229.1 glycoside hydrolase family 19 protein [Pseudomonas sp. TH05]
MPITQQQLLQILPQARQVAGFFVPALNAAMARFKINSPVRMSAFIAQVGHESGQLTRMVENLNYSADRLQAVWPNRFDAILAAQVARKPDQIANIAYGGRMGNALPGDGWKYRGRGLIQLTGANNYRAAGGALGLDLVNHPELVEQPETAALVAGWFWQSNGLNELADSGQFAKITRTINGGLTGQTDRVALRDLAAKVLA